MHGTGQPSDWLLRWAPLLPAGGTVLDLACGSGRHVHWLASQGFRVTAVDRDAAAVEPLRPVAEVIVADIEGGPWPLAGRSFDAVLVTNYLWRPLWPAIGAVVAPGGWLLYETFAAGHERLGRPSRPDFLLQPGELLRVGDGLGLRVVAYESGQLADPPRIVQRMVAQRPGAGREAAAPLLAGSRPPGG
ncbi:MAG TPA: class I SAM-dependent methyltransferase [Ideonella sp.]|uniref:class I SAM-dependent methyltransferase n=1 Tax=Ideonella sp. TaxID=1929293 RepID=UPI002E375B34|nr:class I SAM-dependent methyltransferase [Ideonella sp.]HEX5685194.1 class I SAM-dependent methyltransferase [Ideonella sp.]